MKHLLSTIVLPTLNIINYFAIKWYFQMFLFSDEYHIIPHVTGQVGLMSTLLANMLYTI